MDIILKFLQISAGILPVTNLIGPVGKNTSYARVMPEKFLRCSKAEEESALRQDGQAGSESEEVGRRDARPGAKTVAAKRSATLHGACGIAVEESD
jgi:hypothetical protein